MHSQGRSLSPAPVTDRPWKGKFPQRPVDVVVFGAYGRVGSSVCHYLVHQQYEQEFTLGIAGRSVQDLADLRSQLLAIRGKTRVRVMVFLVDLGNIERLEEICLQTHVAVNCMGSGTCIVADVCVGSYTDYIDPASDFVSTNGFALYRMREAQVAGVVMLHSCGGLEVLSRMGGMMTEEQLGASGVAHTNVYFDMNGVPSLGAGAWRTILHMLTNKSNDYDTSRPKRRRQLPHHSPELACWAVPLPENITLVCAMGGRQSPASKTTDHYLCVNSFVHYVIFMLLFLAVRLVCFLPAGTRFLLRQRQILEGEYCNTIYSCCKVAANVVVEDPSTGSKRVVARLHATDLYQLTGDVIGEAARCLAGHKGLLDGHHGCMAPPDPLLRRMLYKFTASGRIALEWTSTQ